MNNLKDIHNHMERAENGDVLFYQDFNEQFEGYTQRRAGRCLSVGSCFIRISMNNLKDIHNLPIIIRAATKLFYQDFNEQFEGYTQHNVSDYGETCSCFIRISMNNLKDIHNISAFFAACSLLFYQDFNEQFEGYTQLVSMLCVVSASCFIRISMNNSAAKVQKILEICKFTGKYFVISEKSSTFAPTNLKDIHNKDYSVV